MDADVEAAARPEQNTPICNLLGGDVERGCGGKLKGSLTSCSAANGTSPAPQVSAASDRDRRVQRIVRSPGLRAVRHGCSTWATENGRSPAPPGMKLVVT